MSLGRVAAYRFRAAARSSWGGYLAIALLVGLVGGLAMAAGAAARRTQSSFPAFLAAANPSDLVVYHNDSATDDNSSDPAFLATIARLPRVKRVESATFPSVLALGPDGAPSHSQRAQLFDSTVHTLATVDGLFYGQDRPTVVRGRLADPRRADEMVMSAGAARLLGLHLGDVARFGFYTNAQTTLPGYGTGTLAPRRRIGIRLVGIVVLHNAVVQDDVDRSSEDLTLLTPALTRPLARCCSNGVISGLQLVGGGRDVATVEAEIKRALPSSTVISVTSVEEATAERAIEPESIALGVFSGIAALAVLLIAGQAIGRQLRGGAAALETLRAMGAGPTTTSTDGLIGVIAAVVVGSVLAGGVTVALSPLAPIGPVRPLGPAPGLRLDWAVLAVGTLALIVALSAIAVVLAYRWAPHRVARRRRLAPPGQARVVRAAASAGLPVPAVAGIGFALEPGGGANPVPVRSAILGGVLAIAVVVATVSFGASLRTLVSHPALYGWNWDDELVGPYGGFADVPQPQAGRLLDADPDVAAWAGVSFDTFRIDRLTVPVMGASPRALAGPPVLAGHALDGRDQVVLGAATLAELHKRVGDHVEVGKGGSRPARLLIVGTATLPAIGSTSTLHLEMGTGAVVPDTLIPAADRGFGDLVDSPEAILVRFRGGADPVTARRSLQRIATALDVLGHGPPSIVAVQRPAEIVNYRAVGTTPSLLGAGLAAGAVVALGLTLIASVRRRRRSLALLKTLGLTRRQLAAVVGWQASVAVAIGAAVGVPVGIAVGRSLWDLFARQVHVVPQPTVPALSIALIALAALVLANVVAAIPGRLAARTPAALFLRAE
jgi:MacB-like periplasmic core domain/FtsX-like permease family